MEQPFLMFLDHTQRRSTVGRTSLDEWSAHRRDLYLTTHDTHNRQISVLPVGFEPKISAGERPQAADLLRSWPTALLPPRSNGKAEAATAVVELLMMGMIMPETCWAVFIRQAINLRNSCIWLVESFECMMMHGLTNPKFLPFSLEFSIFLSAGGKHKDWHV